MKILSIFNNKGGVGKTTYLYHVAHLVARYGKKVLMVDCDSQCNLTAYSMHDNLIERAWSEGGNSIFRNIEPVYRRIGDIRNRSPSKLDNHNENLSIIPGDLLLSNFEDILGESWNGAKGGSEPHLRTQSALYRYIKWAGNKINADLIMIDLGPNLGALNRVVLGASDYFIVPIAPDLFSIRGTENLGSRLVTWYQEWQQCNSAWSGNGIDIPSGNPTFIGYVVQQHNQRLNTKGMTQGWQIFGNRLEQAIKDNIIDKLLPTNQVLELGNDSFNLGLIPNLHSLIPYSLEARKPVFDCTAADGLRGAHISRARDSVIHFENIASKIMSLIN